MPGQGPPPKKTGRRREDKPTRGDWQPAVGIGWQHGEVPAAPPNLLKASREAWDVWMGSWIAAHWTPELLPGLRQLIRLYDQVERGEFQRTGELRLGMDTYGLTPKGQQDRRWSPPLEADAPRGAEAPENPYGHLRVVNE